MNARLKACLLALENTSPDEGIAAIAALPSRLQKDPDARYAAANFHLQKKEWSKAYHHLQKAVLSKPKHPMFHLRLGDSLAGLGKMGEALHAYGDALKLNPENITTLRKVANFLNQSGQWNEAIGKIVRASGDTIIVGLENKAGTHAVTVAEVLELTGRQDEAIEVYKSALGTRPEDFRLLNNYALLLGKQGRREEAIDIFKKAILLDPENVGMHHNLGESLAALGKRKEAIVSFKSALKLKPSMVESRLNLAVLYWKDDLWSEALDECNLILKSRPTFPGAWNLIGIIETALGRNEAAQEAYQQCIDYAPESAVYYSNLLLTLNYNASLTREELFSSHCRFADLFEPQKIRRPKVEDPDPDRKLRVGYVSEDFNFHSVSFFFEPLVQHHHRENVEVFCYYSGEQDDAMTKLIRGHADVWHRVTNQSVDQVVSRIREDKIDILVDLMGHTGKNRLAIFAQRPAPIQFSWLGYPNTTGLRGIDYRFSDQTTEPAGESDKYSRETILRIPEGFHVFRMPKGMDPVGELPVTKNGFITFGSFNNSAKITPHVIRIWSALLKAVPGSRLLLKNSGFMHPQRRQHVVDAFAEHGIEGKRLIILDRTTFMADHLNQYGRIDIALDTFPYNGTTTTMESLYMGVPVLTILGDRHASRVSASLLQQVGLNDFIAKSENDFVALGQFWASQPNALKTIRKEIRGRFEQSSLADYGFFAQKMEWHYRRAWIKRCHAEGASRESVRQAYSRIQSERNKIHLRLISRKGLLAKMNRDWDTATLCFERAFKENSKDLFSAVSLADIYHQQGALQQAERFYQAALALNHSNGLMMANYGSCLHSLGKLDEADEAFDKALKIEPNRLGTRLNWAALEHQRGTYFRAEENLKRIVEVKPDFTPAWNNLGRLYKDMGRFEDALGAFLRALELDPEYLECHSNLLLCLHYIPDISSDELKGQHENWSHRHLGKISPTRLPVPIDLSQRKLRLAFLSADLHQHPVASFLLPLLEGFDSNSVEVTLLHDGARQDAMTDRLNALVGHYVPIAGWSDADLRVYLHRERVDAIIHLAGHSSGGSRLKVLGQRLVPFQASWLGYPSPLEIPNIDAWLTDPVIAGVLSGNGIGILGKQSHVFTTSCVPIRQTSSNRFRFGCFNQAAKLNPAVLKLWSNLLQRLPNSVLCLKARQFENGDFRREWLERWKDAGGNPECIEFLPQKPSVEDHLDDYNSIDLALDPFPYNGVTTTCEALWMGTPVVSLLGSTPSGRHGASLLRQVGQGEWIAESEKEYLEKAIDAANRGASFVSRQRISTQVRKTMEEDKIVLARHMDMFIRNSILNRGAPNAAPNPGISTSPAATIQPARLELASTTTML